MNHDKELPLYFTNVDNVRSLFADLLSSPALPKRLLVIHGPGGIGKTSLLRMFRLHAKSVHVPVGLASGDENKSAVEVLIRWANDLGADSIKLKTFSSSLHAYYMLQRKIGAQARNSVHRRWAEAPARAASKTVEAAGGALAGAALGTVFPGVGTAIGSALGAVLGSLSAEALLDWLQGFLSHSDIQLLADPSQKLTMDFLVDIERTTRRKRIVLMLDTFEQISTLDHWACHFGQRLSANALLVIAGRTVPQWDRVWPGWLTNAHVEELYPLNDQDMRDLVRRYYATVVGRGEPDPSQVDAIVQFAQGLPLVLTTAVQLWLQYPDTAGDFPAVKPYVVADLVDRLLEGVPRTLAPLLEAAATLRWFDEDILRTLTGYPDLQAAYAELRRFPFVRPRTYGLALHDTVREIIDENLRIHDRKRHRELHTRALDYFDKRLSQAEADEADRLSLELLYHHIRLDETAGMQLFRNAAEDMARYGLLDRLRILLNDVYTYPLEEHYSRLWRDYYGARLKHLEGRLEEAGRWYSALLTTPLPDPRLRAYVMIDYADILRQLRQIGAAIRNLEEALSLVPIDSKLISGSHALASAYRLAHRWSDSTKVLETLRDQCSQAGDWYGVLMALDGLENFYLSDMNSLLQANAIRRQRVEIGRTVWKEFPYIEMFIRGGLGFLRAVLSGAYRDVEADLVIALDIASKLHVTNIVYIARDLGFVVGMQGRYQEAEVFFQKSREVSDRFGPTSSKYELGRLAGFQGQIYMRRGWTLDALRKLEEAVALAMEPHLTARPNDLFVALGQTTELGINRGDLTKDKLREAEMWYRKCVELMRSSGIRPYFGTCALTGLVRVKLAQQDYDYVPQLLSEAEKLAQQNNYNDQLASLRVSQGHVTWSGQIPSWGQGFEAAFCYYQQALVHALRYNRFLLDEVLNGRPEGTPLRPIISQCLRRGMEGRRMLNALREWWKSDRVHINIHYSDSASAQPEQVSLLEAERIIRAREPGDGAKQETVLEQMERALAESAGAQGYSYT